MTGAILTPAVTLGNVKTNKFGEERHLDEGQPVEALRVLLEEHQSPDAWWVPCGFRGNHRHTTKWLMGSGCTVDFDYYIDPAEEKEGRAPLPHDVAAQCEDLASAGELPGQLFHLTPRGIRLVAVFDAPLEDQARWQAASHAFHTRCTEALRKAGLLGDGGPGLQLDTHGESEAAFMWCPTTVVEGEPRCAAIVVMRTQCELVAELAPVDAAGATVARGGTNSVSASTGAKLPPVSVEALDARDVARIRRALTFVDNAPRDTWLRVGMALKSTGADELAFQLWDEWSKRPPEDCAGDVHPKYEAVETQGGTWNSIREFRDNGREITLGTLFHLAKQGGYDGEGAADADAAPDAPPDETEPEDETDGKAYVFDADLAEENAKKRKKATRYRDRYEFLDWEDVAELPPLEWQIEGVIPERSLVLLAGDTEAGKSFLGLDLSLRMIHAMPFCGHAVIPGSVIYLPGEGQPGMAARVRAWRVENQERPAAGGRYLFISHRIPPLGAKTMGRVRLLVEGVVRRKGHAPALIVFDTLSQALVDGDENDAKVISPVLRGLSELRTQFRCSVLVVHHLRKPTLDGKNKNPAKPTKDSIRGSGALTRNVETVLGLVTDDATGQRLLSTWKQKDGEKLEPIGLRLRQVETGRRRRNGRPETSCVMVQDAELCGIFAPRVPEPEDQAQKRADEKAAAKDARANLQTVHDAALLALFLTDNQGMLSKPCSDRFRGKHSLGTDRYAKARGRLGAALVERDGRGMAKPLFLDGAAVPKDVMAAVPEERRPAVSAARPPAEDEVAAPDRTEPHRVALESPSSACAGAEVYRTGWPPPLGGPVRHTSAPRGEEGESEESHSPCSSQCGSSVEEGEPLDVQAIEDAAPCRSTIGVNGAKP